MYFRHLIFASLYLIPGNCICMETYHSRVGKYFHKAFLCYTTALELSLRKGHEEFFTRIKHVPVQHLKIQSLNQLTLVK